MPDTLQALGDLAHFWRQKFSGPVVAITGSCGKTTTKEMIAQVLSRKFAVLKNDLNLNNLIGMPQTLLGLTKEHEVAVVELRYEPVRGNPPACPISPNPTSPS